MLGLRLIILLLSFNILAAEGMAFSEAELSIMIQKLLDVKINTKLTEIESKLETVFDKLATFENKMHEFNAPGEKREMIDSEPRRLVDNEMVTFDGKLGEFDKRMQEMSGVIGKIQKDVGKFNSLPESKRNQTLNNTELEERVSQLEDQMVVVQLGITAVADSADELKEAQFIQDAKILNLEQQVDQTEDSVDDNLIFF